MSIDIHVFDKSKVIDTLKEISTTDKEFEILSAALEAFGVVYQNTWCLQSADYWDDYSPWSEFINLLERMLQRTDGYALLEKCQVGWKYQGENADEFYGEHSDDELPAHPDEE